MVNSFVLVAAAAGASLVAAQNLTGAPDCAVTCLTPVIASICTPADDTACACAHTSDIGLAGVDCLLSSCDPAELTQAQSAGAQVCIDYSATASGVASSTAAASSGASSAAATAAATTAAVTTGSSSNATVATTTSSSSSSGTRATATSTSSSASSTSTDASSAAAFNSPVLGFSAVALVAGVLALL